MQRPDSLPIHTCARCSSVFPPDATIYPDPQIPSGATSRFLCRACFATQGGSKGSCVDCGREVLTITKEGGFVESAGRFWHKRCFRCNSCHKDISHAPMVDLHGKPSCAECFDSCLDRKVTPKKKSMESINNIGGMRGKSRESSPVLEELSERLGIKRQVSPEVGRNSSRDTSVSPSPTRTFSLSRPEGSFRVYGSLGGSLSGTPPHSSNVSGAPNATSSSFYCRNNESVIQHIPITPDLSSCSSSSDSLSSWAPSTPSNSPRQPGTPNSRESTTPKAKGAITPLKVVTTDEAKCGRCFQSLFSISGEGRIVTVPADSPAGFPTSYHASCFRCFVCGDVFDGKGRGHAAFVKDSRGVCHPQVCLFFPNFDETFSKL